MQKEMHCVPDSNQLSLQSSTTLTYAFMCSTQIFTNKQGLFRLIPWIYLDGFLCSFFSIRIAHISLDYFLSRFFCPNNYRTKCCEYLLRPKMAFQKSCCALSQPVQFPSFCVFSNVSFPHLHATNIQQSVLQFYFGVLSHFFKLFFFQTINST